MQVNINNDNQWSDVLATKGLLDVYQQWCGPCRAVVSLFRKIKKELGDELLHFATAEADGIEALEKYRGKCEPTFLFYAGGQLVSVLRGPNAPFLQRVIQEELSKEKNVLGHGAARRAVTDEDHPYDEDVIAKKSCTVAIIKPDVVAHGKADEIIMKVRERTLSEAEAQDFYQHKAAEELIQFMSSGPSHGLVISKTEGCEDVIPAWQEFIGPPDVEEARRMQPESLRAQYSTETLLNALHGSSDSEQASRELAFFFPHFRMVMAGSERAGPEQEHVERTLALIRSDAARENRGMCQHYVYMRRQILLLSMSALTNSHGPVLALVLVKERALETFPSFAQLSVLFSSINQLHSSGSSEEAEREIGFFFPLEDMLAVIKPDTQHKEEILEEIRGRGFTISRLKDTVLSREMAEEFYREHRDKPFFSQLVDYTIKHD
uniref:NME/NM23 family member 9 n=1 Tax=Cyprinus carpio carpio TaxID=630221 RepID=A0A9J8DN03_CYPCA